MKPGFVRDRCASCHFLCRGEHRKMNWSAISRETYLRNVSSRFDFPIPVSPQTSTNRPFRRRASFHCRMIRLNSILLPTSPAGLICLVVCGRFSISVALITCHSICVLLNPANACTPIFINLKRFCMRLRVSALTITVSGAPVPVILQPGWEPLQLRFPAVRYRPRLGYLPRLIRMQSLS